jgi:UDP-glucose 4-epimerase
MNKCLITGGAGFIGSHTVLELLLADFDLVVLDNLCNSSTESLARVGQITGRFPLFVEGDIRDKALLDKLFSTHNFSAVLHFAGLKSVGESVKQPLAYFENNVAGSINLLNAMSKASVFKLVFSSSATVYGDSDKMPISESTPTSLPANPYGRSKLIVEEILRDLAASDPKWHIAVLRYFNPAGAHPSGLIGEDPNGVPNNLVPFLSQVAVGKIKELAVFGCDYDTPDGTGVRDYIHVVDLAQGHLKALLAINSLSGLNVWNLGTGKGYSVLQMVQAFEIASKKHLNYYFAPRREGDIAECWADPNKAFYELGWRAEHSLEEIMRDAWRWQELNPNGYG